MTVRIHIPTPLRRYSDGQTVIEVDGASIGAAFESLFERLPQLEIRLVNDRGEIHPYLILLLGTEEIDRADWRTCRLTDGDELDIVPAVEGGSDVRMRGFRERATVAKALETALSGLEAGSEDGGFGDLAGRVLAEDVASRVNVPPFDRSAMDGYAVVAEDTFGATAYNPAEFDVCGESMPGAQDLPTVSRGAACRIMTGAPLPPGADAVVMAEDCELTGDRLVVRAAVTPDKNVGRIGEDIRAGETVLRSGRVLRPQDVGLLASIGAAGARVCTRPRVRILVTGNELLAPGEEPRSGFIVDSNTPMLQALVERDGGLLAGCHRLSDDRAEIRTFLQELDCDVLLCAGGSSVGREDFLPLLVAELGELPVHGVAMRPSAPTGIGRVDETPVFLLPGNPVSCLCAYDHFAGPAIRALGGRSLDWPYPVVKRTLSRRIASQVGRHDYVRVEESGAGVSPIALSGASLLSSTTRAVGFVLVDQDSEGMDEGAEVAVFLYDQEWGTSP